MSRYWGFLCEGCNVRSDRGYNHGDDMLLAVLQVYPQIKALRDAVQGTAAEGYVELGLMADSDDLFEFLLEHGDHSVVVMSEGGDVLRPASAAPQEVRQDWNTWDGGKKHHENNWYPGKVLGLDPGQEWRIKGAHTDVNGAHGGALAMMVTWESRSGETHMLVYRLSYQYGDVIMPIELPEQIARRTLIPHRYCEPGAEAGRIDYCWDERQIDRDYLAARRRGEVD